MKLTTCIVYCSFTLFILSISCQNGKAIHESTATFKNGAATTSLIKDIVASGIVPSVSLAIFNDSTIFYQHTEGVKNLETKIPADSLTSYEAASLSKTLFAYLVMKQVKLNNIALDSAVSSIWTDKSIVHDTRHKRLTVKNLLSHSSGLPNWRGRPNLEAKTYDSLFSISDSLKFAFEPNSQYGYSGEAYVYLQRVIEKINNSKLDAIMNNEVLRPLQMNGSSFIFSPNVSQNSAIGHNTKHQPIEKYKPKIPISAASLHTNASDYAHFLITMLHEIKTDTVFGKMIKKHTAIEHTENYDLFWGLGIGIMAYKNKNYLFHWGDNGSFKAYYIYCIEDNLGFVYFANGQNGLSIRNKLCKTILGSDVPMWPENYYE